MRALKRAAIGAAVLLTTSLAAVAATEHDNYLYFTIRSISSFGYAVTSYKITEGQPYGGTSSGINKGQPYILVKAGRKKTGDVAAWYRSKVGAGDSLVCDSKTRFPDELNFAIEGNLSMLIGTRNIQCSGVLIGQGNHGLTNNWWMGSPNWSGGTESATQSCAVAGGGTVNVTFRPTPGCVNNFTVEVN